MKILQWLLSYCKNNFNMGISLVVQWLRLPAPNAWGLGLVLKAVVATGGVEYPVAHIFQVEKPPKLLFAQFNVHISASL